MRQRGVGGVAGQGPPPVQSRPRHAIAMSDSEEEEAAPPPSSEWPVSSEWLRALLLERHRDAADVRVDGFDVRPGCEPNESVLSHIVAVGARYAVDGAPRRLDVVVKTLPRDPFSRFFVTEAQFDKREIKFYTEIIPDLEAFKRETLGDADDIAIPIPRCYQGRYVEPGAEPAESVLVLADLRAAGYAAPDFARGLTLRQATAAVDAIARVHALSLARKTRRAVLPTDAYAFLFQTRRASDSYQQLIERGLPQLSRFLEGRPGLADVLGALNALRPHTRRVVEALLAPEEPMALVTHTDFWCNNLMFKEDDEGACACSILDWQMVTYSRATNDVALLLVSSLPAELRRLRTDALLDAYWASLTRVCSRLGVDVEAELAYDRARLQADYKRSQLLALLLCIGSVDLALGNAQMEERLLELLKDLHRDGLLSADVIDEHA